MRLWGYGTLSATLAANGPTGHVTKRMHSLNLNRSLSHVLVHLARLGGESDAEICKTKAQSW